MAAEIDLMAYQARIIQIDDETVLAECGPMRLTIQAQRGTKPLIDLAIRSGYEALDYLERIAGVRQGLSLPHTEISAGFADQLPGRMLESVRQVGDADLTPMAAVAGTIADAVADWVFKRGATRVVVENGGDISVRLAPEGTVSVGIRPSVATRRLSHYFRLTGSQSGWGIATSGLGGRSLTRGIASAVTVLADCASVADAAATAIANACYIPNGNIVQMPAEQIDPATDIAGIPVTVGVGPLDANVRRAAVQYALDKAGRLTLDGVIKGAMVASGGENHVSQGLEPFVNIFSESMNITEAALNVRHFDANPTPNLNL